MKIKFNLKIKPVLDTRCTKPSEPTESMKHACGVALTAIIVLFAVVASAIIVGANPT